MSTQTRTVYVINTFVEAERLEVAEGAFETTLLLPEWACTQLARVIELLTGPEDDGAGEEIAQILTQLQGCAEVARQRANLLRRYQRRAKIKKHIIEIGGPLQ
jgi:hypothetical protein